MTVNKVIDRNGRLFGKVSIIDVVVVLLVLVMAFALHVKNNELDASKTTGSSTPITFTCLAENLPFNVADAVQVGDKVYDKDRSSGGAIGTITAIEVLPGSKTEQLKNGTFAKLTNEDTCNLLITVEGSGMVSNGRYSINRIYELGVNASRNFYTNYALFMASVTAIW